MTAAPVVTTNAHLTLTGGRAAAVVLNSGCANAATGAPGVRRREGDVRGGGRRARLRHRGGAGLLDRPHRLPAADGRDHRRHPGARRRTVERRWSRCGRGDAHDRHAAQGDARATATASPSVGWPRAPPCSRRTWRRCSPCSPPTRRSSPTELTGVLRAGVAESFNAMSVDGCTSTNDTVILLASGEAGAPPDSTPSVRRSPRPASTWPSRWWATPKGTPRSSRSGSRAPCPTTTPAPQPGRWRRASW